MTLTTEQSWQEFLRHYRELSDLRGIDSLLGWDQSTYQPPAAAEGRSRQMALLARLTHAHATDADYGRTLDALQGRTDLDPAQARMLELARKDFEENTRLPAALVGEMSEHWGRTYTAWAAARPGGDWDGMVPLLEKSLDLTLQAASHFPQYADPHDYYIGQSDEGMSAEVIAGVFADLQRELVPLVQAVTEASEPRTDFIGGANRYGQAEQLAFGERVIRDYGYDFTAGRQDLTHHPFMTRLGDQDIRITTRVRLDDPTDALYSTLHESGHAMYEQGIAAEYLGTPLGGGVSSGVHESQSRLWENLVGRSREFWAAYGAEFRATFPGQLAGVSDDELYRASNVVRRSLIRTDADELTYNLHVILRFNLERELLAGRLAVRDLADAWQAAYRDNLGLEAPGHQDGVLQDVHWFFGPVAGAFQGYTLGNIMSGQIYAAARRALPELDAQIARREFGPLHTWLREHIYQHGRLYTPEALIERATGAPLAADDYLAYLRSKYGELYGLNL
ncbi:carboxypeptidase M32 [Deinococcus piscis]|uniref:Metal-dependent carboxypeptidase n=1 Tax=Deinococcus piscis TaxID=394230 RepID=A0ABQ3JZW2_9DEIO|nr:carboxypeptidase M32 [Deinococcus piscis]GHF92668.1 carboxypeptidase M32 [Deinococcus piscis]